MHVQAADGSLAEQQQHARAARAIALFDETRDRPRWLDRKTDAGDDEMGTGLGTAGRFTASFLDVATRILR